MTLREFDEANNIWQSSTTFLKPGYEWGDDHLQELENLKPTEFQRHSPNKNASIERKKCMIHGYARETFKDKDVPLDIIYIIIDFYGLIRSNLSGDNNPLTQSRIMRIQQGMGSSVHFEDHVTVHVVPYSYQRTPSPTPPTAIERCSKGCSEFCTTCCFLISCCYCCDCCFKCCGYCAPNESSGLWDEEFYH